MIHPTDYKHVREELGQADITLDGKKAYLSGWERPHAIVWQADNFHNQVEFAWATVQHIIENSNGQFKS